MINEKEELLCPTFQPLQVNFFVGAFYDGVHLLGMALNETLTNKQNIRDGKAITSLMWNRTFNGKNFSTRSWNNTLDIVKK